MMLSLRGAIRGTQAIARRHITTSQKHLANKDLTESASTTQPDQPDADGNNPGLKNINEPVSHPDHFLSQLNDHREDVQPVAKNFFIGKLDPNLLSYPDVLQNDRYFSLLARCKRVKEHFEDKRELVEAVDKNKSVSKELLLPVRSLGGYGLQGKLNEGGQGLGLTESFRVTEEFGVNLSVSRTLTESNTLGVRGIARWGTQRLRDRLVNKLYSGELTGCLCITDSSTGSDPQQTKTRLVYDEERGCYVLNGEKTWVTNAPTADVFTVFALMNVANHVGELEKKVVAVVVERGTKGMTVEQPVYNTIGMKGLKLATVQFTDVIVPMENFLGTADQGGEVLADVLIEPRAFSALETLTALRTLYNKTVKHTLERQAFGKDLCEFDVVKNRLGMMASKIYALESMLYMTAGLQDVMLEPDVTMEANMCKLYAMRTAREVVQGCTLLHGGQAYLEDSPLAALGNDLKGAELWEGTEDLIRSLIAICGIAHFVDKVPDIGKLRDFMANPMTRFRHVYTKWRMYHGKMPRLTLKLYEGTHPSLCEQTDELEGSLLMLHFAMETGLVHHGMNFVIREVDQARLADSATNIYAMMCTLSRASRSYCIGHQDSDHEVEMATVLCFEHSLECRDWLTRVQTGFYTNNDFHVAQTGGHILERGRYCAEHPIKKNIF